MLLQASELMQERDGLAKLARELDVANTGLRLALKLKEEKCKGLAQSAQVGLHHAFLPASV